MFDLGKFGATIELDSSKFDTSMDNAEKRINDSSKGLGGFAKGVGKIVAGLGVFKLIEKGFSMVTSSVGRAIGRVDALKQFPRVLEQMGYGADEAQQATKRLVDGIDGLPTTLDGITGTVQRMVNVFKDVDKSTESAIALNNAFLASGASTADAERGLDQYIKMLSTGKVNMESWMTLQETMPYALQATAEAFGYTGKSAQNDFYEALKSGEVTLDEFNDKMIELSEKQGGFAEVAKEATKGINTSWTNIKTSIANGVAGTITAFDNWFESKGFGGISGILDSIKEKVGVMFGTINELIPQALDIFGNLFTKVSESTAFTTLKEVVQGAVDAVVLLWQKFEETGALDIAKDIITQIADAVLSIDFNRVVEEIGSFLETWSPLLAGIAAGVIAFELITGAIALWTTVTTIATGVAGAFAGAIAFITSPIGIAVAVIGTLIAAGVALWKNWDTVKKKLSQLWDSVKKFFGKIGNFVSETKDKVIGKFNDLLGSAKSIFNNVKSAIMNPINTAKNAVVNTTTSLVNGAKSKFNSLKSSATTIFNNVKSAMTKPINAAKDTIQGTVDKVKGFFSKMKLSFPKIKMPKLPRFSLKGKFSLAPPSVPKLSIDWHAKGGIFTKPTVLNTRGGLHGFGEVPGESEAVLPLNTRVLGDIGKGISATMGGINNDKEISLLQEQNRLLTKLINKDNNTYLDGKIVSETVSKWQGSRFNMDNYAKGNR